MSRKAFLQEVTRTKTTVPRVFGTWTSIVCQELMEQVGAYFPDGHTKTGTPENVRRLAGPHLALMGGIGNLTLLQGTPGDVAAQAGAAVAGDIDVIGPECAIPLATPLANLKAIVAGGRQ